MPSDLAKITLSDIESKPEANGVNAVHLRARDIQATYLIIETDDKVAPYTFLMYEHSDPEEAPCISLSCANHRDAAMKVIEQYCEDNIE